jgi:hypothetical protein
VFDIRTADRAINVHQVRCRAIENLGTGRRCHTDPWTQWREYRRRSVWSPSGCGEVKLGYEGPTGRVSTI